MMVNDVTIVITEYVLIGDLCLEEVYLECKMLELHYVLWAISCKPFMVKSRNELKY